MKNVVMDIYMYYWLLNDSNKYRDNDLFDDESYEIATFLSLAKFYNINPITILIL